MRMEQHRRLLSVVFMVFILCSSVTLAAGRRPKYAAEEGWTHVYHTSRETVGVRMMPYKAFKFRADEVASPAALRARMRAIPDVAAVRSGNDFMDANGIVLVELAPGKRAKDARARLGPGPSPQFYGDVFSPFPEADSVVDFQMMLTPFLYVSYVIPPGGGDIAHLLNAYGGTIKETFEFSSIGIRGYVIECSQDDDIFQLAELYALDPNVRAAAPEFLSFHDSLAGPCPFGQSPNPEGCEKGKEKEKVRIMIFVLDWRRCRNARMALPTILCILHGPMPVTIAEMMRIIPGVALIYI